MSDNFTKKNIKLSLQFNRFLSNNPHLYDKIPNKSILAFTIKGDRYFNQCSKNLIDSVGVNKRKIVEIQKQGSKWKILSPAFA
jgi:hypothetical protein